MATTSSTLKCSNKDIKTSTNLGSCALAAKLLLNRFTTCPALKFSNKVVKDFMTVGSFRPPAGYYSFDDDVLSTQ